MRRLPAVLLLVALVAAGFLGARALVGSADGPPAVAEEPAVGPVLLVTGYGGGVEGLTPLAQGLRAAGREVIVVPPVGDGTGDLLSSADALAAAADGALGAGAPSVDVVGYSAGGVVAHLWAAGLPRERAGDVRRVVTLGSPHAGTQVAGLALAFAASSCVGACPQLAPGSELLAGLGGEVPDAGRWTTIWTADDQVVTPPDSAVLDGARAYSVQDVCSGRVVAHGDLTRDPAVRAMVLDAIGEGEPVRRPDASAC